MQDLSVLNCLSFDQQIEREVIATLLNDPAKIKDVYGQIQPDDFYTQTYRVLCDVIFRRWIQDEKTCTDPTAVLQAAKENSMDMMEVARLYEPIFVSLDLSEAVKRLKGFSALRKAQAAAARIAFLPAHTDPEEINRQIAEVASQLTEIGEEGIKQEELISQESATFRIAEKVTKVYEGDIQEEKLGTGLKELDKIVKLRPGEVTVVGARPGMGKTAFSLKVLDHVCGKLGKRALYFSLEMDHESMILRMVQMLTKLEYDTIKDGLMTPEEYQKVCNAFGLLANYPVVWSDTPGQSVSEMLAKARKVKREGGLDFIIIDYLGLIAPPYRGCDTMERVSENAKQIQAMARALHVPIMVLCQLSRAPEARQDKRPILSDLRDSGEIEQAANIVMFLYRDSYYYDECKDEKTLEILVRKNRNGQAGAVTVFYDRETNTIADLEC